MIAAGKGLFAANCAACHGEAGKGDGPLASMFKPPPKDLASMTIMLQSDGALFWKVSAGRAPMPAFDVVLSEEQRWQLVGYLRTLGPTPPRFDAGDSLRLKLSDLLRAYQSLSNALVTGQSAAAGQGLLGVVGAIEVLKAVKAPVPAGPAREAWTSDLGLLDTGAAGLNGQLTDPAGWQRPLTTFSEALVRVLTDFGHAESDSLQVFTAPDVTGAASHTWVQGPGQAVDPYVQRGTPSQATLRKRLAPRPAP